MSDIVERLPYELRLTIGMALDRLVCDESTPEQVDEFIATFAGFGLHIVASERLTRELSEARAAGRAEGVEEAARILSDKAAEMRANDNPTSTAMAMIFEEQAAAIRAAKEKP